MPDSSRPSPPTCPDCGYHAGQAAAAHLLYTDEQSRADYYRQEYHRLADELRATKRELSATREERDIEGRKANRLAVTEGEAA
jgi:hypothetical protein